jgi:hypothetical protein
LRSKENVVVASPTATATPSRELPATIDVSHTSGRGSSRNVDPTSAERCASLAIASRKAIRTTTQLNCHQYRSVTEALDRPHNCCSVRLCPK